jgi:hypothetical protein
VLDGVPHHREVLLQRRTQRQLDVPVVALRDDRDDRCARVAEGGHERVVRRGHPGAAGGAEGRELRVLQVELGPAPAEELGVLRVRSRPAALDEADAEVVQVPRDHQLVGDGEVQPLLLGTVAQRRVVDVERVVGHAGGLFTSAGRNEKTSRDRGRSAYRGNPRCARGR